MLLEQLHIKNMLLLQMIHAPGANASGAACRALFWAKIQQKLAKSDIRLSVCDIRDATKFTSVKYAIALLNVARTIHLMVIGMTGLRPKQSC